MNEKPADYGREVRDTVVKSGLTGVAATFLAVTVFSPAGMGGLIGTSLASGFGLDSNSSRSDDPYAHLPPYPAPLTAAELAAIHDQLARTTAELDSARAATDAKIEYVRSIAVSGDEVTFAQPVVPTQADLRLRLSQPEPAVAISAEAAAVAPRPVAAVSVPSDPHLELAELLLAHETF